MDWNVQRCVCPGHNTSPHSNRLTSDENEEQADKVPSGEFLSTALHRHRVGPYSREHRPA